MLSFALLVAISILWPIRPAQIARDGRALELFDRYGTRLGMLYSRDERHAVAVPLQRIAPAFFAALIATEDRRFFSHGAIDPLAAVRAAAVALAQRRAPGGASTITMQLARLLHPITPDTFGKLREIVDAARIESGFSKRDILEAYVNRVPMGSNLYGVEAAARTYFGIDAADLDLAQAALLAALPNDPVRLDPYRHFDALAARQRLVLARMADQGFVDTTTAARAGKERLALVTPSDGIVAAPHFLFWLTPQIDASKTSVATTLDLPLQRFVQAQARDVVGALGAQNVHDAAAVVVDNRSGDVLAYVGSPDYFADEIFGRNDGVQALRQPGSALKPFLYELALERRVVRPTTILQDVPTAYALPGAGLYAPQDYSRTFRGPVRVRAALANSLNIPAVRVLEQVGVPAFLERLHALGFAHLTRSADYYGLGLGLGGGEVSLFELARAYAVLARGGAPVALHTIRSASPADASVRGDARSPDATWALVRDMLADAHARAAAFGVDSVLRLPFSTFVKTGTSSDYRDTWTVGSSRDYTVAVWVGNFDGSPMHGVTGVTGAGPLWNRIMLHLHEHREPRAFDPPRGYVRRPICATTGASPNRDCRAIVGEYLDAHDLVAYARVPESRSTRDASKRTNVVFPRDGDRFAYSSDGGSSQRLVFTFDTTAGAPNPTLDGQPLASSDGSYLWPLVPGVHVLRAKARSAPIHFRVVAAPIHRAGFSAIAKGSTETFTR